VRLIVKMIHFHLKYLKLKNVYKYLIWVMYIVIIEIKKICISFKISKNWMLHNLKCSQLYKVKLIIQNIARSKIYKNVAIIIIIFNKNIKIYNNQETICIFWIIKVSNLIWSKHGKNYKTQILKNTLLNNK